MLVSDKELKNLKLKGIRAAELKNFAESIGVHPKGSVTEIIKSCVENGVTQGQIDSFIKSRYSEQLAERRRLVNDDEIINEVTKLNTFNWGVVQGQLDQKIQTEYVRRYFKYDELVNSVKSNLHSEITNYVLATWYNHWTTILIEDHISSHPRVIPTLKNNFGVDLFFDGQPFDLKITYLPKNYSAGDALANPKGLAIWMYENQGALRFGSDNRLFIVLLEKEKPEDSWKLKRDFKFVYSKIDSFFDTAKIDSSDEVIFSFKSQTYTTISKVLIIAK